jgi:hypothetical protein
MNSSRINYIDSIDSVASVEPLVTKNHKPPVKKILNSYLSWVMMIFIGLSYFGSYYCYDFPASLED